MRSQGRAGPPASALTTAATVAAATILPSTPNEPLRADVREQWASRYPADLVVPALCGHLPHERAAYTCERDAGHAGEHRGGGYVWGVGEPVNTVNTATQETARWLSPLT